MKPDLNTTISMNIKSEEKNIKIVSAEILNFIKDRKKHIDKDTLFDIKLCVEEALRNAMIHGNKSDAGLDVLIGYEIAKNTICISIKDYGKGFEVKKIPDPTEEDNLYKGGGRGVYIIHRLMDHVQYVDNGSRVIMKKKLV